MDKSNAVLKQLAELNQEVDKIIADIVRENKKIKADNDKTINEKSEIVFNKIEFMRKYMYSIGMKNCDNIKILTGINRYSKTGKAEEVYIQLYPNISGFGIGCILNSGVCAHYNNIYDVAGLQSSVRLRGMEFEFVTGWNECVYETLRIELAKQVSEWIKRKHDFVIKENKELKDIAAKLNI